MLDNVQQRGAQLRAGLAEIAQTHPTLIAEVRGWGLIDGLELQADSKISSIDIVKACMDAGLLLVPAGPSVVRFVPPLIVSASEVEEALTILGQVIQTISASV